MRKRFRGNQPIAVSREIEGDRGGQLYAGGETVKESGIGGVEKADAELIEGVDGQFRSKR